MWRGGGGRRGVVEVVGRGRVKAGWQVIVVGSQLEFVE